MNGVDKTDGSDPGKTYEGEKPHGSTVDKRNEIISEVNWHNL